MTALTPSPAHPSAPTPPAARPPAPPPPAPRSLAVDGLKLALAAMVVGIHADPFAGLGRTLHLLTGEGLFRLGVPVFLVLNGYFLQGAIASGRGWAVVRRFLGLYALWMALYLPIYAPLLARLSGWEVLRFLAFGYWHLWYLAGLVMAAAAAVLMARWPAPVLAGLAAVALATGLALAWAFALGAFVPHPALRDPLLFNRNPLFVSLPFLLAGVLMRRWRLTALPRRRVQVAAGLGVGLVLGESLILGALPRGLPHDLMLGLALAAPALALAALQVPAPAPANTPAPAAAPAIPPRGRGLADYSAGIYFLHVAFVALLFRHTGLPAPAVYGLALAGAAAGTWGLRRSGLARHLL